MLSVHNECQDNLDLFIKQKLLTKNSLLLTYKFFATELLDCNSF
jgi:hypothetical protein